MRITVPALLAVVCCLVFPAAGLAGEAAARRITVPPATPAGTLVEAAPFERALPAGARGWRIFYTTTLRDGAPAVASAIIVTSARPAAAPRPVVAWAHGTTGIAEKCAPSLLPHPFAGVPAMQAVIDRGWAFVATDYIGLGTSGEHAYLVGDEAARAVLDAVRAARQLPDADAGGSVVVWGHSQGGNAALWAGGRAPDYAPDVALAGIAALAPATDLPALVEAARASLFGKIVTAYLYTAYSRAYADIGPSYVFERVRPRVAGIAARCVDGAEALVSAAETFLLPRAGIFAEDPAEGSFGERLRQNTPTGHIDVPVLIGQGADDDLVRPDIQMRFVRARCGAGQPIDYRIYEGRDHVSLVAAGSPLEAGLMAWTEARFAGIPPATGCTVHRIGR